MICPRPNTHDPSPTAVPIKEAIKVFMPRPQLFIRQKPQFRSIRVPLFCRDPSPSHVTVAKSRFHSLTLDLIGLGGIVRLSYGGSRQSWIVGGFSPGGDGGVGGWERTGVGGILVG